MNDRIRELAEQAVNAVDNPFPGNPLNDELEKMYIPDCFAEKFTELIVKETLKVLCEKMDEVGVDLSNLPAWYKALERTETHFGVEDVTKDEVLKLELDALKTADKKIIAGGISSDARLQMKSAITALRKALEQPDPVEVAVLAEREACAKVCDEMDHDGVMVAADCAAAIRERMK